VFPYKGKPMDNPAQENYKRAVRKAGLPRELNWHSLRHTWASWRVQNGTSLGQLMELGGWASPYMVLRYAHLAPTHLAEVAGNVCLPTSHRTGHTRHLPGTPRNRGFARRINGVADGIRTHNDWNHNPGLYR